jgi:hypothetical protein
MMNYVNDGYFTKVSNGVFRFTKSGQDYFSAGTVTKEPAEAGSLNVVSTADSSVMPDPKSSASEPFQRSTSTLPGSTFAPADPINPQLPPIMRR